MTALYSLSEGASLGNTLLANLSRSFHQTSQALMEFSGCNITQLNVGFIAGSENLADLSSKFNQSSIDVINSNVYRSGFPGLTITELDKKVVLRYSKAGPPTFDTTKLLKLTNQAHKLKSENMSQKVNIHKSEIRALLATEDFAGAAITRQMALDIRNALKLKEDDFSQAQTQPKPPADKKCKNEIKKNVTGGALKGQFVAKQGQDLRGQLVAKQGWTSRACNTALDKGWLRG